jgi:choline kinase
MTTVVHLAAGRGSRLRPLTDDRPKPLVELAGRSLLDWNVETLDEAGVDKQVVVTGYKADAIEDRGYETVHNENHADTEMVYSLFCAEEAFAEGEDLIISYGDIVYDRSMVEALLAAEGEINVVVDRAWRDLWEARFENPLDDAESLRIRDGRITSIGNEDATYGEIEAQYVGLVKVRGDRVDAFANEYRALDGGELDPKNVHMTRFLQHLIDDGWVARSVPVEHGWIEVDTLSDLEMYRDLSERGELDRFVTLSNR